MDLVFSKVDEVEVPHCEVGLTVESQAWIDWNRNTTEITGGKSTDQRMPPRVWPNPELLPPPEKRPHKPAGVSGRQKGTYWPNRHIISMTDSSVGGATVTRSHTISRTRRLNTIKSFKPTGIN